MRLFRRLVCLMHGHDWPPVVYLYFYGQARQDCARCEQGRFVCDCGDPDLVDEEDRCASCLYGDD